MISRQNRMKIQRWVFLTVVLFFLMGAGAAFAKNMHPMGTVTIDDSAEPLRINATIMEINLKLGYVIIAEKKFELAEYTVDQEKFKLDAEEVKHLKKDMRVIATGFQLADGRIIAEKIEAVNSRK